MVALYFPFFGGSNNIFADCTINQSIDPRGNNPTHPTHPKYKNNNITNTEMKISEYFLSLLFLNLNQTKIQRYKLGRNGL